MNSHSIENKLEESVCCYIFTDIVSLKLQRFSGIAHMTGVVPVMHKGFPDEKGQEGKEGLEFRKLCLERGDKPVKSLWERVTRQVSVTDHLIPKRKK